MSITAALTTPLHFLIQSSLEWKNCRYLIESLLEQGADINACDNKNGTPLFYACHLNHDLKCIKFLLKNGSQPDIKYENQKTSLHYAILENNYELTELLLQNNANPSIQNSNHGDALDIAKSMRNEKLIQLVQSYLPEKLSTSSLNPVLILRASQSRILRTPLGVDSLESFHQQIEIKKKNLGIPDVPQYFIESFPCEFGSNSGDLHIWQFHLAFEPTISTKKSVNILFCCLIVYIYDFFLFL